MGTDAQVYLGSAELAAVCALLGHLPNSDEYMEIVNRHLSGEKEKNIYQYLNFHELEKAELELLVE